VTIHKLNWGKKGEKTVRGRGAVLTRMNLTVNTANVVTEVRCQETDGKTDRETRKKTETRIEVRDTKRL